MPKIVIESAWITLNGIDVSNRVKKVTLLTAKRPAREVTAMGDGYEDRLVVNIKNWKASFELLQDYSTGSVYAALKGIFDSTVSSGVAMIVRPTTGARTTGNPEWQGSIVLDGDFGQLDASVGEEALTNPSFLGNGTLSFLTSSS